MAWLQLNDGINVNMDTLVSIYPSEDGLRGTNVVGQSILLVDIATSKHYDADVNIVLNILQPNHQLSMQLQAS